MFSAPLGFTWFDLRLDDLRHMNDTKMVGDLGRRYDEVVTRSIGIPSGGLNRSLTTTFDRQGGWPLIVRNPFSRFDLHMSGQKNGRR